MGRLGPLGTWGFEMQSGTAGMEFSSVFNSPSIDTTIKHGGAASGKISSSIAAGTVQGFAHVMTMATSVFGRAYVYIDSLDASDDGVVFFEIMDTTGATSALAVQFINLAGTLRMEAYANAFGDSIDVSSAAPVFDQWMRVEFEYNAANAGATDVVTIKLAVADPEGTADTVGTRSDLTLATTPGFFQVGVFNSSGIAITGSTVYFDDICFNTSTGSVNNSFPGSGIGVIALPTAAGDNAATAGLFSYINEIPPSDTATAGGTDIIELDTTTAIGDYNVTDTATLGISSSDTINMVAVVGRIREEIAGTSNYTLRIKSASGGTTTASSSVDAGNATPRTNPSGTTAFAISLVSETDPTTGVAWTSTGTNSIESMQIGAATTDGFPDTWCLWLGVMIEYIDVAAPPSTAAIGYRNLLGVGI